MGSTQSLVDAKKQRGRFTTCVCKANCHSSTLEISRGATLDDLYQVSASRMLKPTSKADSKPIHRRKILCRSKGENALKAAAPL